MGGRIAADLAGGMGDEMVVGNDSVYWLGCAEVAARETSLIVSQTGAKSLSIRRNDTTCHRYNNVE
jgi:hypothetical protein